MAESNQNYTPEQTSALLEAYDDAEGYDAQQAVIREFADENGKTVPSVRAKLVREGVYQKKEYAGKTGEKPETKDEIVEDIARTLGVDADSKLGGLEKARKDTLQLIRKVLLIFASDSVNEETKES
jgi:hypothetical protein